MWNTEKIKCPRLCTLAVALISCMLTRCHEAQADRTISLVYKGLKREALVHIPPLYRPGIGSPLVLAFHGGGGTAAGMVEISRLNDEADRSGFIVVYPQGSGSKVFGRTAGTWNAGTCCGTAMQTKVDDVGFVSRLLDVLEKQYSVDAQRIYATGISNGGQMSYRLGCQLADRIAAIAPVAATLEFSPCSPSRPVPLIRFHGTEDPCALYDGGTCGGCYQDFFNKLIGIPILEPQHFPCPAVVDDVRSWSALNGCRGNAVPIAKRGHATCVAYQGCPLNADVVLWSIAGMGHAWPGGTQGPVCNRNPLSRACRAYVEAVGPVRYDISASQVMWEFFRAHPLSTQRT